MIIYIISIIYLQRALGYGFMKYHKGCGTWQAPPKSTNRVFFSRNHMNVQWPVHFHHESAQNIKFSSNNYLNIDIIKKDCACDAGFIGAMFPRNTVFTISHWSMLLPYTVAWKSRSGECDVIAL